MLSELKNGQKVVGLKQSRRAVAEGKAVRAYLAEDADPHITDTIEALCGEHSVPVEWVAGMRELGAACGISVGAAVAVLLA